MGLTYRENRFLGYRAGCDFYQQNKIMIKRDTKERNEEGSSARSELTTTRAVSIMQKIYTTAPIRSLLE
jgi:hypothetical protein